MYDNYKIMEHLKKELDKKADSGIRNISDLDTIMKLAQTMKDLVKAEYYCTVTEAMEQEGGYSQHDGYSERRRRDSRGRYSRSDGNSFDGGNSYESGNSYRRGYSREGGYSGAHERYMDMKQSYRSNRSPESKKEMLEAIDEFMDEIENLMQETKSGADTREEREKIQQRLRKLTDHM